MTLSTGASNAAVGASRGLAPTWGERLSESFPLLVVGGLCVGLGVALSAYRVGVGERFSPALLFLVLGALGLGGGIASCLVGPDPEANGRRSPGAGRTPGGASDAADLPREPTEAAPVWAEEWDSDSGSGPEAVGGTAPRQLPTSGHYAIRPTYDEGSASGSMPSGEDPAAAAGALAELDAVEDELRSPRRRPAAPPESDDPRDPPVPGR